MDAPLPVAALGRRSAWLGAVVIGLLLIAALGCATPPPPQCLIHSDCRAGMYCRSGACRTDCRADFDCKVPGQVCELPTGRCLGAPDGGLRDAAPSGDSGTGIDLASPASDLAVATPDLAAPPPGGYGDVCRIDGDCASKICSSNPFAKADRECTGDCKKGCMIGDFCVGNVACAQSDIGALCNVAQGGQDCRGGACLGVQGFPASAFCTRVCASAADCPAGYSCSLAQNTRVCVQVDLTPRCAKDADCWYGTLCDATRARCLGDCRNDADCPLLHFCGQLGGRRVCAPNQAAGAGGLGAACKSDNDCRGATCLVIAGKPSCSPPCAVTVARGQFCPGGWGCNPVDDGNGGYTLACLPAGAGSPGAPCNDNTQCASGVCIDDGKHPKYCTRFCNGAPCPQNLPLCDDAGLTADGVKLRACSM